MGVVTIVSVVIKMPAALQKLIHLHGGKYYSEKSEIIRKGRRVFIIFTIFLFAAAGCSDGKKLTKEPARRALQELCVNGEYRNVRIKGIQDLPERNEAIVQFEYVGCEVRADGAKRVVSAPGRGRFTRFNDGRWVLTDVVTSPGDLFSQINWNSLNIEAG